MKIKSIARILALLSCVSVTGFAEQKTTPDTVPDFVKENLKKLSEKPLKKRNWDKVKVPGFKEQQRNAFLSGKKTWQNVAPGYTNVIYDAKLDNGVITIVLDGAGLAQSKDGGKTWKQISYGIEGNSCYFAFDISPADPNIIVLAGRYLSRTIDGGKTWCTIYSKALPPFVLENTAFCGVKFNADGSRVFTAMGSLRHNLRPAGSLKEKYMATLCKNKTIYIGDYDAGKFKAVELNSPFAGLRRICPHPKNPNIVYISFGDGELYVTRNAKAEKPEFIKLNVPDGFEVVGMDVSPWNPSEMLMVMQKRVNKKNVSKVMLATDSGKNTLEYKDVPINDASGKPIFTRNFFAAKWNPRRKGQVFVGLMDCTFINYIVVSDDSMKSFRKIDFPEEMKYDENKILKNNTFYSNPHDFAFDPKSDLALSWSCTGGWTSRDEFKTWNNLLMTYDPETKYYGNKGVGFAECPVTIFIRPENAYVATNDHGVFRSKGNDYSKWTRISNNKGMPKIADGTHWTGLAFPMGASQDEKFIYLVARKRGTHYSCKNIKIMRSGDKGETWEDATALLGNGDVMHMGKDNHGLDHVISEIMFDPTDSQNQWIVASNALYCSRDGGKTFTKADSPVLNHDKASFFRTATFDGKHKILYLGNHCRFAKGSSLARSFDYGKTWEEILPGLGTIYAMDVTSSGNLVLGIDGKLLVVPYDKIGGGKIKPSMVKMTTGDTPQEFVRRQMTFRPIVCDGENIIAFTNSGWQKSNISTGKGPLLSEDGGKTFRWIAYDLPCTEGVAASIGNGKILVGNRGLYYWKYK